MSQLTPTSLCANQFESQVNGVNNSGDTDIFHFISDGTVVSWIDFQGFPGGNLSLGGGGSPVFVNGTPVSNPNFVAGANITYTVTGSDIVTSSTGGGGGGGVPNVNGITGAVSITGSGSNIVSTFGNTINIAGSGAGSSGTFVGPNPWTDTAVYNMRAVSSAFQTTANCTNSSANVTLSSASQFQNGDGIVLYNCGPAPSLIAPSAPTVTPSVQSGPDLNNDNVAGPSGGSTSYSYQIVARDVNGGMTAASVAGTTSTGPATLGVLSNTVATLTRSFNIVTVVTGAPSGAAVGGIVFITNSTDATFSGFFVVTSVTNPTTFTYTQGMDVRAGASTSATGGTATTYQTNYITWTAVVGAWQYYIYKSGTLIGVTRPGENHWADFGVAAPALPDFVPTSAPVVAIDDYLATTIISGAGTTSITLATTASNNTVGSVAKFDNGPTLLNAYNATNGKSTLHISAPTSGLSYFINSHTVFGGSGSPTILQGGGITLNETLESGSGQWIGELGGACINSPQFSFTGGQCVAVNTAYPGFYAKNPSYFNYIGLTLKPQGLGLMFQYGYGFNSVVEYSNFLFTGSDLTGQAIVFNGCSNVTLRYCSFLGNDASGYGYSLSPQVLAKNDAVNADPSGNISMEHCFWVGRGFGLDSNPVLGASSSVRAEDAYAQALRTPLLSIGQYNGAKIIVDGFTNDTSSMPTLANWGGAGQATISNNANASAENAGPPGLVTGGLIYGLTMVDTGSIVGQNTEVFYTLQQSNLRLPIYGYASSADYVMAAPLHFPSQHTLFWDLATPTNFSAVVASGGGIPSGANEYAVSAVGVDGGETSLSVPSTCTTTTGNNTCNLSWNAVVGAASYNLYDLSQGTQFVSGITATSYSDTGHGCCNPVIPNGTGTGLTTIMRTQVITPQLNLGMGVTFSQLGTSTNGTVVYCSDCTIASTCGSGGTGAIAKRLNSAWVCN